MSPTLDKLWENEDKTRQSFIRWLEAIAKDKELRNIYRANAIGLLNLLHADCNERQLKVDVESR